MEIGIVGCGIVGGVLIRWLEENTKHTIRRKDPQKGLNDDLTNCVAIFFSVPVPTNYETKDQDLSILRSAMRECLGTSAKFFVRSTVLPGTCDALAKDLSKDVYHMPEFLTERTAYQDFCEQKTVVIGGNIRHTITDSLLPGKIILDMTNLEAELTKYTHNCFAAVKVNYFNMVSLMCRSTGSDMSKVLEGARITGFIEKTHTQVPGPDSRYGFGGKCLPKDLTAFIGWGARNFLPTGVLSTVESENIGYRYGL